MQIIFQYFYISTHVMSMSIQKKSQAAERTNKFIFLVCYQNYYQPSNQYTGLSERSKNDPVCQNLQALQIHPQLVHFEFIYCI